MAYKILLAESNYLLREGLKSLLRSSDYAVTAEVDHGDELFEKTLIGQPDLVIINFKSAHFSLQLLPKIKSACPSCQILAITDRPSKEQVSKAIELGVNSYLMIDCDRDEILDAIKATLNKDSFYCGKILNEVIPASEDQMDEANQAFSCNGIKISSREAEIISLVAEGLTNKQIAEQLFLSTHTVITHRKNIMNKLGLNNTAGLVLFAIRQNIISPNKFLFSN